MNNPYLSIAPKPTKAEEKRRRQAKQRAETVGIREPVRHSEEETGRHVCFLCGRNGCTDPLDKHHAFGGALRKKCEQYGAFVYLCHNRCHENGKESVHRSRESDLKVKRWAQKKIMEEQGWTEEEFIREFGRNYV